MPLEYSTRRHCVCSEFGLAKPKYLERNDAREFRHFEANCAHQCLVHQHAGKALSMVRKRENTARNRPTLAYDFSGFLTYLSLWSYEATFILKGTNGSRDLKGVTIPGCNSVTERVREDPHRQKQAWSLCRASTGSQQERGSSGE